MEPPDKSIIEGKLSDLASERLEPGEAADWATAVLRDLDDEADVDDSVIDALGRLSGADLLSAPGVQLHGREDFQGWLAQFRADVASEDPA